MKSNQKKIRDLTRILKKLKQSAIASDRRTEREEGTNHRDDEIRLLEERISKLAEVKQSNKQRVTKRKHEGKYHMVKFFERKKVTRLIHKVINQLRKLDAEVAAAGKDDQTLRSQLIQRQHQLEDDLTYVMYYPVHMKYVALFASSEAKTHNQQLAKNNIDDTSEVDSAINLSKNEKLISKARELAMKAREEDILQNNSDRVARAIQVELQGQTNNPRDKERPQRSEIFANPASLVTQTSDLSKREYDEFSQKSENFPSDVVKSTKKRKFEGEKSSSLSKKLKDDVSIVKVKNDVSKVEVHGQDMIIQSDEFFLEESNGREDKTVGKGPPINYQQIKQAVNKRKFQHFKRFSSKPSNIKQLYV